MPCSVPKRMLIFRQTYVGFLIYHNPKNRGVFLLRYHLTIWDSFHSCCCQCSPRELVQAKSTDVSEIVNIHYVVI